MKTINEIRKDFPFIESTDRVYFDNGASTQKPQSVIDAVSQYNINGHANIHRGAYDLSILSTEKYDQVRSQVASFVGAAMPEEIIFTRGATEAVNLVATSYGLTVLSPGDEIVVSIFEHHSNIVPWQQVAKACKATLKFIYDDGQGCLDMEDAKKKITTRTKILAITGTSNALGTKMPVDELVRLAHSRGAKVLVDAAQWIGHESLDVQALDVDFLVFSGHKIYGPTGVGVLYGKKQLLDQMNPYQFGGDMIEYVSEQETTFAPVPAKFEAGTPNIEGVIGLGAALAYVSEIGYDTIRRLEDGLMTYAYERLSQIPGVTIYGPKRSERGPILTFNIEGLHPHDMATLLNDRGICIRAGHHCAQPLMKRLNIYATCRASLAFYNTKEEVDRFIAAVEDIGRWLKQWQ